MVYMYVNWRPKKGQQDLKFFPRNLSERNVNEFNPFRTWITEEREWGDPRCKNG